MKPRMLMTLVAFGTLAVGAPRTASAQAQPDADGLARAVASVIADALTACRGGCRSTFIPEPRTAFDSAVAVIRHAHPRAVPFGPQRPPSYGWIGTRGFTMRGDTAAVLVEAGSKAPSDGRAIDTYIEENLYLFIPDGAGWRFLRREFVRGMDLGPVRG